MVMESRFHENFDCSNNFSLDDENTLPVFDQFPGHTTGYRFRDEPFDLSFLDTPGRAPNHDAENTQGTFDDPLSQATGKSLYEQHDRKCEFWRMKAVTNIALWSKRFGGGRQRRQAAQSRLR
ncbi:hypothetical protein L2E82_47229 [Cichorium intybus]|uniref:Uncharacterized protein n=1 Tax=Cichorium intybus TaxID=13427 RepID=A0ACB8YVY7_CICIN|nr:hypothetical protein L2E82_47229 [Cichorium intybus]